MRRLVAMVGNGKIHICADEDLEVLFMDRDGTYIEVVSQDLGCLARHFSEYESDELRYALRSLWQLYLSASSERICGDVAELESYSLDQILGFIKR